MNKPLPIVTVAEEFCAENIKLKEINDVLLKALKNIKASWECLDEGEHTPSEIEKWLVEKMAPAITKCRKAIAKGKV